MIFCTCYQCYGAPQFVSSTDINIAYDTVNVIADAYAQVGLTQKDVVELYQLAAYGEIVRTLPEIQPTAIYDYDGNIMSIIITGTTLPAILMFCIPYFVYSFSHYLKRTSLLALNSTLSGRLADRTDIEIWR